MEDSKLDAESVTRNKSYGPLDHLEHLLKIGWEVRSPLIQKFLKDNFLNDTDAEKIITKLRSNA